MLVALAFFACFFFAFQCEGQTTSTTLPETPLFLSLYLATDDALRRTSTTPDREFEIVRFSALHVAVTGPLLYAADDSIVVSHSKSADDAAPRQVARVSAGNTITGLAASPDGTELFYGDSSGSIVDAFTGSVVIGGIADLRGISYDPTLQQLYWIDGPSSIFFGSAVNATAPEQVVDMTSAFPGPWNLQKVAVDSRFRRLYWADPTAESLYSLSLDIPGAAIQEASVPGVNSVAADISSGVPYASFVNGETTGFVRVFGNTTATTSLSRSTSLGPILAISIDASLAGECSKGTFTEACRPCPAPSWSNVIGSISQSTCDGVCGPNEYCNLATAVPIPSAFAVASLENFNRVFDDAFFRSDTQFIIAMAIGGGILGLALVIVVIWVLCARWRCHKSDHYKRLKGSVSAADVFFRSRHRNETPGLMVHRKSIMGGIQSVIFLPILILIAVGLALQWQNNSIVTSASLPFGYAETIEETVGQFRVSAAFWGFAGTCCDDTQITVAGLSRANESVTCLPGPFSCNITWESGESISLSNDARVTIEAPGGHAAFISWEIKAPTITFVLDDEGEQENAEAAFVNRGRATVLPANASVFKGATPTEVDGTLTYVIFRDETTGASVRSAEGWLLSALRTGVTSEVTAARFNQVQNSVGVSFNLARSPTYLAISVENATPLGVLIGAILGYGGSVVAALVIVGKALEWSFTKCCHKPRSRTMDFFMAQMEEGGSIEKRCEKGEVHRHPDPIPADHGVISDTPMDVMTENKPVDPVDL